MPIPAPTRWLLLSLIVCLTFSLTLCLTPASSASGETIYVKLLVDEEEPAVAAIWEKRLRARLQAASDVISAACGIRFVVRETGTWDSDDRLSSFHRTLSEFEQEVSPDRADLAIGFTSQYRFVPGRAHLGGTRGPLHPHILIRESNPQIMEAERTEVLTHELGHYLGAVHAKNQSSVMRAVLGDGQARSRQFRIAFDNENVGLLRLVAREMNNHGVARLSDLSRESRGQLQVIYARMAHQYPEDSTAAHYYRKIGAAAARRETADRQTAP